MQKRYERRHSRWYEKLLFSHLFQLVIGCAFIAFLPALDRWGWGFWRVYDEVRFNTLVSIVFSFVAISYTFRVFMKYPGVRGVAFVFPVVSIVFLLVVSFLFFTREPYSRSVLFSAYLLSMFWYFLGHTIGHRYRRLKLGLVPFGSASELTETRDAEFRILNNPDLKGTRLDGIVADLRAQELSGEWEHFLAVCALNFIPVYHVKQIQESLTGRVRIDHLSENQLGTLLPSALYMTIKRFVDIVTVLITLPLTLPIMAVTAFLIKLDSPGPVFFIQERVGQGNKSFRIYKFRSMVVDSEKAGAKLAQTNDVRITRFGKFIRKTRLDEFPQFFNVLKGDMSLIGPRPEQRAFVDKFEKEIPFYIYRHVVKPGITGWAQVVHGYASDADDTRIKIQHDFYYIKNFSFWLDVLVVFKTIKTILTGFGAK